MGFAAWVVLAKSAYFLVADLAWQIDVGRIAEFLLDALWTTLWENDNNGTQGPPTHLPWAMAPPGCLELQF